MLPVFFGCVQDLAATVINVEDDHVRAALERVITQPTRWRVLAVVLGSCAPVDGLLTWIGEIRTPFNGPVEVASRRPTSLSPGVDLAGSWVLEAARNPASH